jgi:excisionase family DNA binding protein
MPSHPGTRSKSTSWTMTVPEVARRLGISRAHAYRQVRRGSIPGLVLGRRVVVPTKAIEDLLGRPISDVD